MSAGHIDKLLQLWAASLASENKDLPFDSHVDLYETIDATRLGDVRWESFRVMYSGNLPAGGVLPWMKATYKSWDGDPCAIVKNCLSNRDFKNEFEYSRVQEHEP